MLDTELGIGIDVGSTTTKAVLIDRSDTILAKALMTTGASAVLAVEKILGEIASISDISVEKVPTISTGYGRARVELAQKTVTEITCHSVGVHRLNPDIRLLIDVGGQDSKVIRIGSSGRPDDFELNDKCSAGTGRFPAGCGRQEGNRPVETAWCEAMGRRRSLSEASGRWFQSRFCGTPGPRDRRRNGGARGPGHPGVGKGVCQPASKRVGHLQLPGAGQGQQSSEYSREALSGSEVQKESEEVMLKVHDISFLGHVPGQELNVPFEKFIDFIWDRIVDVIDKSSQ